MSIKDYHRKLLRGIRHDLNYTDVTVWHVDETQSSNDAYGRSDLSSGSGFFSGSVGWGATYKRQDTAGGFYEVGDVEIGCSLSAITGSGGHNLRSDNIYLVAEGVALKIMKIVEAHDTNEMVLYCERINN